MPGARLRKDFFGEKRHDSTSLDLGVAPPGLSDPGCGDVRVVLDAGQQAFGEACSALRGKAERRGFNLFQVDLHRSILLGLGQI